MNEATGVVSIKVYKKPLNLSLILALPAILAPTLFHIQCLLDNN